MASALKRIRDGVADSEADFDPKEIARAALEAFSKREPLRDDETFRAHLFGGRMQCQDIEWQKANRAEETKLLDAIDSWLGDTSDRGTR